MGTQPWNDWYHVMCNTYGTWLPGDPKGFRTRHHREHCEGDYRNPPPKGAWDLRHRQAFSMMKRTPVYLTRAQQDHVANQFWKSLRQRSIETIVLSLDRVHLHLLARFPDREPRQWVGIAKKESSHYLKVDGLGPEGGIWAVRCKCQPIRDRFHQLNVVRYIRNHWEQGALIRYFRGEH
jgi:hypothetical protein